MVAVRERAVIVDLTGLKFIDSSGVAAPVLVRAQAWRAAGDLSLAAPQDQVMRLLALTRVNDVFSFHASPEQVAGIAGRLPGAGQARATSPGRAHRDRKSVV